MRKCITITRAPWGGHHLEVSSETGAFLKDYDTTKKITEYNDDQLLKVASIIDVDVELLKAAVSNARLGKIKKTSSKTEPRTDLGFCFCGCGEYLQKKNAKFLDGHYNVLVKKLRDCLKADSSKEDREWAKAQMQKAQFTERNLYVGGKLPKGVIL